MSNDFFQKCSGALQSINEALQTIEQSGVDRLTLLKIRRELLSVRLSLLREKKKTFSMEKTPLVRKSRHKPLSENKKKMLRFIRGASTARVRDIVDEFNILSERTVKRNLSELIEGGLVRRQLKDNRVLYSLSEGKTA
jgi:predicted HTH transcriptional regulator